MGRVAKPQRSTGLKRYSVPPLPNTSTNIGRIASSTGVYGKKVGGSKPSIIAVRVRGKRAPKGRGTI